MGEHLPESYGAEEAVPQKKANTGLIVGIVVGVIALCCCCIFVVLILILSGAPIVPVILGNAFEEIFENIIEGIEGVGRAVPFLLAT